MAETMLQRAARLIESGEPLGLAGLRDEAATHVEEVADRVALVPSFSNVVAFSTGDGLVLFDVAHEIFARGACNELRSWSNDAVNTAVYTHGHVDHVTGAKVFEEDAATRGAPRIQFVGHTAVPVRFDRYKLTNGYNGVINMRQFRLPMPMWPTEFRDPDHTYETTETVDIGGVEFELHHARGETDDHTWAWVPSCKAVCVGDLFIWQFPNAGNPQKVQRYAWEWAVALRAMAAKDPELLLPAHGLPIGGRDRVRAALLDTAAALESLQEQTLALMNAGARLNEIIHTVRVPDELAAKPYLTPTYDEPEFVVRNIWRLYGGWYDGNPASLKPAADVELANEIASLSGGAIALAARAEKLAADGDLRMACHLVEFAALAAPDDAHVHEARAAIYDARRKSESSFMASGIYRSAALDSRDAVERLSPGNRRQ